MNTFKRLAFSLTMAQALFPCAAWAGEGIKAAGPIGGTDIRQAWLPPPGLYAAGVGIRGRFKEFLGSDQDYAATGDFMVGGGGLLAVYPVEVFGGSLASSVFVSGGKTCFGLKSGRETCSRGMGDTYADLLVWSRLFPSKGPEAQRDPHIPYGLQVLFGLGVSFPNGVYKSSKAVNNGSNVYDTAPNVALTYTSPSIFGETLGDATEFSVRMFYNHYSRNDDTNYQSGDLVSADFSVSQRVRQWQFGVTGTGYVQIEDDENAGVKVPNGGNRGRLLQLGPVVSYDYMARGRPWNVTLKGYFAAGGENIASSNILILRIGTKLF
ncbi:hypothetical protein FZ025_04820 [Xanthomonas hyacinthi]|uniref:Transporter n=1 Tax=Xanthomonas hyacinthi TaxID=56455 RepID=A0A2S7F328_9XANT|nr:transporter [Xanthomonas hyacinthi]KLD75642.1 hypothetical protein Y886_25770 [Xanthomonas hyacinthi DSM 19077]PPU99854.1 hypothetical protein XhyaCFBP1156_01480 [Xanthomonas hyacinthi]QGY76019.1 hypothetical protein FZ025_04820 [Xanthomonas hyacinthi]